jgi:monoamine oxidase
VIQRKTIVIGAGLAGLTAARTLMAQGHRITVLEARDRIGGRAFSLPCGSGAVDLGPAWIWPRVQPKVIALLDQLGLTSLPQFEDGTFIYETAQGVQRGNFPRRYGDAARIRGGVGALAHALADSLPVGTIALGQAVAAIDLTDKPRITTQSGETWTADAVICAAPAPIAATWDVAPDWPPTLRAAMTRWPTWMAAQAKIVVTYHAAFWRAAGVSGSAVSQVGPLVEISDQCDPELEQYALFGFVGWPFEHRRDEKALCAAALAQLVRLFGPQAAKPTQVRIMDWASEPFTSTKADQIPPAGHPPYGAPDLSDPVQGRLFFAGAEVSPFHGGLIEGAIESGLLAGEKVARLTYA